MISKTFRGYEISKRRKGTRFPVYVQSIYKGEIKWTTDYTYAKHYSEKTAKRIDAEIDKAINSGKLADQGIIADAQR